MRQRRFVGRASSVGGRVSGRPSTADEVSRGSGSRFPSAPWLRKVAAPRIECKVCLFFPNAAVILEIQRQGGERVEEQATDRMDFLMQSGDPIGLRRLGESLVLEGLPAHGARRTVVKLTLQEATGVSAKGRICGVAEAAAVARGSGSDKGQPASDFRAVDGEDESSGSSLEQEFG
ncbi:hypothetical protein VPH35_074000 [Triticum aestivum]